MSIFKTSKAKRKIMSDFSNDDTCFDYRTGLTVQPPKQSRTEISIGEFYQLLRQWGKVISNEEILKKDSFKARKVSELVLKVREICSKVGRPELDGIWIYIIWWEYMHCIRQRNSIESLYELVVNMNETNLYNSDFLEKTCDVQDYIFTYFIRYATKLVE